MDSPKNGLTDRIAPLVEPSRVVLRGIGQVMFQEHAGTGLLFLIGIAIASPLMAAGAVLGALIGPGIASLLKFDRRQINAGLFGFNSTLVGVALLFYLQPVVMTWILLIAGCALASILTYLMRRFLKFPTYTAPFILVTWLLLVIGHRIAGTSIDLQHASPSHTPQGFIREILNGAAEVMFGANIWTGLLFIVGIGISCWPHAVIAVLGSVVGTALAIYHGDPGETISIGIFGYNAALAAMAIYLWRKSLLLPILAALVSVPLTEFFPKSLGIPALTAPFVVAAWLVLLVGLLEARFIKADNPAV